MRAERALAASLPFTAVPAEALRAIRADLAAWSPVSEGAPAGAAPLATALQPHLRLYLLGLLSAKLGDHDGALRYTQELERLDAPPAARRTIAALVATIRADVAFRRNQPAEALRLLETADGHVPLELVQVRPFVNARQFSQEHARFLRAEAFLALGRDSDARRSLETSFLGSPLELVYLAPLKMRLERIRER